MGNGLAVLHDSLAHRDAISLSLFRCQLQMVPQYFISGQH